MIIKYGEADERIRKSFIKYNDTSLRINKFILKKDKGKYGFYNNQTWVIIKELKESMLIKSVTDSFESFGKQIWIPKIAINVTKPYDGCLYIPDWVNLKNYK